MPIADTIEQNRDDLVRLVQDIFTALAPEHGIPIDQIVPTLTTIASLYDVQTVSDPGTNLVSKNVFADTTANDVTLQLPPAGSRGGTFFFAKKIVSEAVHHLTLVPDGSDTIEGGVSVDTTAAFGGFFLVSNGLGWYVLAKV